MVFSFLPAASYSMTCPPALPAVGPRQPDAAPGAAVVLTEERQPHFIGEFHLRQVDACLVLLPPRQPGVAAAFPRLLVGDAEGHAGGSLPGNTVEQILD